MPVEPSGSPELQSECKSNLEPGKSNYVDRCLGWIKAKTNYNTMSTPNTNALENKEHVSKEINPTVDDNSTKSFDLEEEVQSFINGQSGKDRLTEVFSTWRETDQHPHLQIITQGAVLGGISTGFLGGYLKSAAAVQRFSVKNKLTKWDTKFIASRARTDSLMTGFIRGAVNWSMKSGLFIGCFLGISQSIAIYRNKTSALEYIVAGVCTGALARSTLGLRGFVAGGLIGSLLGIVGGTCFVVLLKSTNESQENRHYRYHFNRIKEERETFELTRTYQPGEKRY